MFYISRFTRCCDVLSSSQQQRLIILFPGTLQGAETGDGAAHAVINHVQNDGKEPGTRGARGGARDGARDACAGQPCQGGGTCESHDGTFTCYCRWAELQ